MLPRILRIIRLYNMRMLLQTFAVDCKSLVTVYDGVYDCSESIKSMRCLL